MNWKANMKFVRSLMFCIIFNILGAILIFFWVEFNMKTVKTLLTLIILVGAVFLSLHGLDKLLNQSDRLVELSELRANNHDLRLKVTELRKINKFNCLIEVTPVMEAEMDLLITQARRISEMIETKILEE